MNTRAVLPDAPLKVLTQATGIIGSFFLPSTGWSVGFMPCEHLTEDQRLTVAGQRQMDGVDVGRPPDVAVLDAAQDGVVLLALGDDAARALLAVVAVVVDPGFAKHLPAEAAVHSLLLSSEYLA